MRREPPSRQRCVALASVHMCLSIDVSAIAVNHRFSLEVFVFFEWIVRSESVCIDGQRLLLVVSEEESHGRSPADFAGTTYR